MKTTNPDHPIRNTLKHLALAAAMAAALYFGAAPASAQTESIPIQQPSFESGNSSFLTAWPGSGFGIHGAAGGLTPTVGSLMAYSNGGPFHRLSLQPYCQIQITH